MTPDEMETSLVRLAGALDRLAERVTRLEKAHAEAVATVDDHDDRLDEHERQLGELRASIGRIQADIGRLANEMTASRGSLHVVDKNVKRLLEIAELQANKTVVVDG